MPNPPVPGPAPWAGCFVHLSGDFFYSIPFPKIMKGIFLIFSDFFANFLKQREGAGEQEQQQEDQVGGQAAQRQNGPAEGEEIGNPTAEDGQKRVDPHLSALHRDGPQEQHQGGGQPEQKVQQGAHRRQTQAGPGHPHQVIEQPQAEAQTQPSRKGGGLGRDGHLHLSPAGGRRTRPAPGGSPHSSTRLRCLPPSGLHRPATAFRCADPGR